MHGLHVVLKSRVRVSSSNCALKIRIYLENWKLQVHLSIFGMTACSQLAVAFPDLDFERTAGIS